MNSEEKEELQYNADELINMSMLYNTPKHRERIELANLCENILANGNDELIEAYAANLNKEYSAALHERFVANFGTPSQPRTFDELMNAPPSAFIQGVFDVLRKIQ